MRKLETSDFFINYEVEICLVNLIENELKYFEKIDVLVDKLFRYKDFNISYIVDILDNNYKDYINELEYFCLFNF